MESGSGASSVDIGISGFDGFFHEHHGSIVRALGLALGDEHLARDAAAEGFTKALQRWRRVEQYANPAGWVYRVGLNWGRSRWRKTRREVSEHASDHGERSIPNVEPSDPRLIPALHHLSTDHRVVVVARYYLDWSEQEIATALDIRPGTVKSRLSRALERLAVDLGAP
ncbi:MAG: sigma-70 family RNA polymerase sigma factor [Ilumatobacter sp.]|uniref:RNA polymerase sigma factor n=1 Tax=Ilumatobacter sp. TaxID=1967498 RepID=UPI003C7727A4